MATKALDREMKKGSAEMVVLAMLEDRQRHGYEIAKVIETRSGGAITFQAASLYPILYRLETRGLIEGRWVEKRRAPPPLLPAHAQGLLELAIPLNNDDWSYRHVWQMQGVIYVVGLFIAYRRYGVTER